MGEGERRRPRIGGPIGQAFGIAGTLGGLALSGCAAPTPADDADACDPRTLAPGEVRARRVPCGDELIGGGEGRSGDWLVENAVARFVVRGTYAALTELDEPGGTLIDAAAPGGLDLLLEYRPDGDRSAVEAVNGDGWAELVLPGVVYHLDADADALEIRGGGTGRLLGVPAAERTGATLRGDGAFLGLDGAVVGGQGAVDVEGATRLALSTAGMFPDGVEIVGQVDADGVRVERAGVPILRLGVEDGVFAAVLPEDAEVVAERDGCAYDGLALAACGTLRLRVADEAGDDLRAAVVDGDDVWTVPKGGGTVEIGPDPRQPWVWAGPAYTAAQVRHTGGDSVAGVTLFREMETDGWVLAAFAEEAAPDADSALAPLDLLHRRAAEGVGFAAVLADDEVPSVDADAHDAILAVAASRAGGWLWSWPWSPNGKKAAHGAVPWPGLGALDQLAVSEGGDSAARRTVVTAAWVDAALLEAHPSTWDPRPDAIWLGSRDDLGAYFDLLDAWVDVTPVAESTWVPVVGARNVPAVEEGVVEGRTTAGTGPRLALSAARAVDPGTVLVTVRLDAPRWAAVRELQLWGPDGAIEALSVRGSGEEVFRVDAGTAWVVAVATGERARPWGGGEAWAASAPLWLGGPGYAPGR